jgi:hypothetical protein
MINRLQRFLRWLGALLVAWGTPPRPAWPDSWAPMTPESSAALRELFARPSDPGACPTCGASWLEHHCPFTVSTSTAERQCEVCNMALSVDAVRTHDGKWRCRAHKESV